MQMTKSSSRHAKFDKAASRRPEKFFERFLVHIKGEWADQPLTLEKWQAQILRELFGWIRPDGLRRYRTAYIEVPRKNGKSTICAGIALYLLFADGEPGAEIYSAAADREQAAIVFDMAKQMVEHSPKLSSRCQIYQRSIVVPSTGSSYKVLSADVPTKHGLNPHAIIFDELHVQPNRYLWDVLNTGTAARRQPLTIAITTAGYDRHSIGYEQHDYAEKVRDGIIPDESFLPIIYAAGKEDDFKDPRTWKKANPNYGISVKPEYLAAVAKRTAELPAEENTFRRLHLNQWTEQSVRWMPMNVWDECASSRPQNRVEWEALEETFEDRVCFGGLDLSNKLDLTALVLGFPIYENHEISAIDFLCRFWVPEEGARKRGERDRVPYPLWIQQGLINAPEGEVVDYAFIRRQIQWDAERFRIKEIAFDPWNATQLATELEGDGIEMVELRQGFQSLTEPTKKLMELALEGKLRHHGHPVLRWNASNVSVKVDAAGNLKPDKEKSTEKIDGIVAMILALARIIVQPEPRKSVYETRGLLRV